jgi:hypothetical protein
MNRRTILIIGISAATVAGLALLPAKAIAQQKSLKDQLVGTWNLATWERTAPDGSKVHTFGTNPKGVNVFSADGRFFILYARADLPKLASNVRAKVTPQEAVALYLGTIAYNGTYTVDDASKTITFHIETTTFPNQLGMQQKRVISSITADDLKYANPTALAGGQIEVTFKRAK